MTEDRNREVPATPEPPIADPAPIGLTAFALTTFILSCVNAGFISGDLVKIFVPLALFYGGLTQLVAGFFELRNRNMFGATAFCGYGAFWISLGFLVFFEEQLGITKEATSTVLAWTLLGWTIFTLIMWLASFGLNPALAVVFTLLLATLAILTIGEFLGGPEKATGIIHIGGYVGIATAIAAWYTGAAEVLNDTYGRTILPLGGG